MHPGDTARRRLCTLTACLLLSLITVADGLAGEHENMGVSNDRTFRGQAKRIAEIEARERGVKADRAKRADKITNDRITGIKGALKGGGKARSLRRREGLRRRERSRCPAAPTLPAPRRPLHDCEAPELRA